MRQTKDAQMNIWELSIASIKIDTKSRDDIPPLLRGLQYIHTTPEIRQQVFEILETMIPSSTSITTGRPGMYLWNILVLGTLRLNLNWDYDRLLEMVNHHTTIRQMLGHDGFTTDPRTYKLQTLKDNVRFLTPEILDKINLVVVKAGHKLVKKKDEKLIGKCDSFVVETDVDYPTDIGLLLNAMRKTFACIDKLLITLQLSGWRQSDHNFQKIKRLSRKAQKARHSGSKDPKKKEKQQKVVVEAYRAYIEIADHFVKRANESLMPFRDNGQISPGLLSEIDRFIGHATRQIDQIKRRVINGEVIPHSEKVFSIFEEHTEWISKGKAGVPVELGLRVCVIEDQHGFLLNHNVMQKQTDDKIAVSIIKETQEQFPDLKTCSFDKGFYSPENSKQLEELLDLSVLPQKGRLSKKRQEIEYSKDFRKHRRQHSAIESAINGLEVHGLDRCHDHGITGFKLYVSLAIVARNIQQLGVILLKRKSAIRKRAA